MLYPILLLSVIFCVFNNQVNFQFILKRQKWGISTMFFKTFQLVLVMYSIFQTYHFYSLVNFKKNKLTIHCSSKIIIIFFLQTQFFISVHFYYAAYYFHLHSLDLLQSWFCSYGLFSPAYLTGSHQELYLRLILCPITNFCFNLVVFITQTYCRMTH